MTATFTQDIKSFYASHIIKALQVSTPNLWQSTYSYTIGNIVGYNNSKYIATNNGISGTTPPTHTNGIASDGVINWLFVENLIENDTYLGNLYFFIGKSTEWVDENSPDVPISNDISQYENLDDLIALKRIESSEHRIGIKRYDWTENTLYDKYNPNFKQIVNALLPLVNYSNPFYVITDELNIYKCLDNNNNGLSTNKPTGTSTSSIVLADGYVWKYMGTVSSLDSVNYLTTNYIPVEYKKLNDSSNQWNVQEAAQKRSVSGFNIISQIGTFTTPQISLIGTGTGLTATVIKNVNNTIRQVIPITSGQNYDKNTYGVIKENGVSGSGALATATIVGGIITGTTLTNIGSNYTSGALVLIEGDGTGAILEINVALDNTISDITITNGGTGYTYANLFIIPGVKGAIVKGILSPILGHGYNIVSELGASAIILGIRLQTNTYFITGNTSDFRKFGILINGKDDSGLVLTKQYYIAKAHPNYLTATGVNKLEPSTGNILYINNIEKVERSTGQEDYIRIVLGF